MEPTERVAFYTRRHMLLKLAEELSELSAEVLKHVNKPDKDNMKRVTGEMHDVIKWMTRVQQEFNIK